MESVMERRNLLAGLIVLAISMFMLSGTALAHGAHVKNLKPAITPSTGEGCTVTAEPGSFMDQGEFGNESTVATIVEIECEPKEYGDQYVAVSSQELYARCGKVLSWIVPPAVSGPTGPGFGEHDELQLDDDGNASVVVFGGGDYHPCQPGGSLITAEIISGATPGLPTVSTEFTIVPPEETTPGLTVLPEESVEAATESSTAAIVEIEFPAVYAEQYVNVQDRELYNRCGVGNKLSWIGPDESVFTEKDFEAGVEKVKLDDDGNAYVVMMAGESCGAGKTLVEASLEKAPYTTLTAYFTVLAPKPTYKA